MRERPLFYSACVFLMGLAYQRYEWQTLCLGLSVFLIVEVFYGMKSKKIKRTAGRCLVLLSAFILGMAHMKQEEAFRETYLSHLEDDSKVVIWGEIIKLENTDYGVRMILSDSYIRLKEEKIPCNKIMVYASSNHFHVGEIHKITGQLHKWENSRNQGGFNALCFYQSQKIDFSVQAEENVCLGKKEQVVRDALLSLREKLAAVYELCMETKTAGFYTAMLLGDKTNLEKELKDLFTLSGISHILAISGLHMSMIGRGCYKILRKLGLGFGGAGLFAGILLILYCEMVGNGVSAVRAAGMLLLFFLGQFLGESYDMLNALGAMCWLMLWDNPFLLEYSGFWFSVMALVGVGFVGKVLSEQEDSKQQSLRESGIMHWRMGVRKLQGDIKKGLWMSFGITLTTLPITAFCYYEIPLYSPLVNCVVLPILTPIFVLALTGGLVGIFCPWISYIVFVPCSIVVWLYEEICRCVIQFPFSSIIIGKPAIETIVLYYLVLFAGVWRISKWSNVDRIQEKIKVGFTQSFWIKSGCKLIVGGICIFSIIFPKPKPFEMTFLDVGQGDGIYISTGDGITCFVDGGSTSEDLLGEYTILPFLKSKGIRKIDYWFVSHADTDHISGLLEVLERRYKIGYLVVSEYIPRDENFMVLLSLAQSREVPVLYMDAGDQIVSECAAVRCIYPWDKSVEDRNEASLVLEMKVNLGAKKDVQKRGIFVGNQYFEIRQNEIKVFLAGDISAETEQVLLNKGVLDDVWLYKASHHGSKYSNSLELLEVLQPEVAVVSCSKRNRYGHPGKEAIENMETIGCEVFYTMNDGQVTVGMAELSD